jgi:hypothetical protein
MRPLLEGIIIKIQMRQALKEILALLSSPIDLPLLLRYYSALRQKTGFV